MFEYEDLAYAALTPTDEDAAEAYIFSVEYEDQGDEMEFTLTNIDDEKKLEEVGKVFMQLMSEAEEDIGEDSDDEGWDEFIHKKIEEL